RGRRAHPRPRPLRRARPLGVPPGARPRDPEGAEASLGVAGGALGSSHAAAFARDRRRASVARSAASSERYFSGFAIGGIVPPGVAVDSWWSVIFIVSVALPPGVSKLVESSNPPSIAIPPRVK